ncbi:hypothetical protein AB0I28_15155 [Phytomonospora sp. NPDC050363]|uniref:hypothetical protein n=1 Tax=Phytomonospora sp. NPDC050363 TaxID=3155642 RepID=UPI0033F6B564
MTTLTRTPDTSALADGTRFLRTVIRLDAVVTGLAGLMLLATGLGAVENLSGIPLAFQTGGGAFLIAFAAGGLVLASRPRIPRGLVWAMVVVNAVWVVDCAVVLVADLMPLTAFGLVMMIGQAVVVAVFAELEYIGLRKTR